MLSEVSCPQGGASKNFDEEDCSDAKKIDDT
jgi:hypothetical protein